jgi:DNA-binding transcriptional LysR family regulator
MGRPPPALDATAVAFAPHPLVIVAGVDHPLTRCASVAVEDLAGETLIVREAGSGTRSAMEEFFQERSIKPRVGMEMASNEAIKQAVVAGLGISFISQHTLGLELSAGRLSILKVEGTPVMRRWHLVRHKSKHLTPVMAAFWDFVLEFAPAYLRKLG